MFVSFDKQALILKKWWKKTFHGKPKHEYHVSQGGEHVYRAQPQK